MDVVNRLTDGSSFGFNNRISHIRYKQKKRRHLLAQQFGLTDPAVQLKLISGRPCLFEDEVACKKRLIYPKCHRPRKPSAKMGKPKTEAKVTSEKKDTDDSDIQEYTDSTTFLKGTQSANPHNDYCQHFVDTGERPQNFIRDTGLKNRFEEYPKLRELIRLKDELIADTATPPMYLKTDLATFDLRDLQCKFDVILIEPPLEEYNRNHGAQYDRYWSWDEIEQLEIEQIAAQRSFVWIWCGSGEGLDRARKCLRKWGFRRCEDICWIKTNRLKPGHKNLESKAVVQRTKEHCLMGIKGTVRRSTDGDFIHANVDIDLIIAEEEKTAEKDKAVEIFHMIEHFCLGRRRLHLFGRDTTIRQGWLTVGPELSSSNLDTRIYSSYFTMDPTGAATGSSEEIERLRPKSPPPRQKPGAQGGGGGPGQQQGGGPSMPGPPQNMQPGLLGDPSNNMLNMSNNMPSFSSSGPQGLLLPLQQQQPSSYVGGHPLQSHHQTANLVNHMMAQAAALSMFNPYNSLLPSPNHHHHHHPLLPGMPGSGAPGNAGMVDPAAALWEVARNWGVGNMGGSRPGGRQGSRRDWQRN